MRLVLVPQAGREQAGERPVLVLSDQEFNATTGLAFVAPVTSRHRGWPFEVVIPAGGKVRGVVQSDQTRSLDYAARHARFICAAPEAVLAETLEIVALILNLSAQDGRTLS